LEASEYILLLLSSKAEGINGRTALQKLGYFGSVKTGIDLGYGPDFYGPYSTVISATLQNMVESDFIVEQERFTNRYRKLYTYNLTEESKLQAKQLRKKYVKESRIISSVVKKCEHVANLDYNVLSWAAKVHFVLSQTGKGMTHNEAISSSRTFGWQLNEQQVKAGAKLLQELKLIKKT